LTNWGGEKLILDAVIPMAPPPDLSSPIEESEKLFAAIDGRNEVAIGSRALDHSLITMHPSGLLRLAV